MSVQAEQKKLQNYQPKPVYAICSNCKNFTSEKDEFGYDSKLRCKIGGFAVKKTATCDMFTHAK